MNFEQKLNVVLNEMISVYKFSNAQASIIRQNILARAKMYQSSTINFHNDETKIIAKNSDIGDLLINRLVTNIRNYDFDQTYNKENTLKGAYTSHDQSLYVGSYKFIEDITRDKLKNNIPNVDEETLRKASLNVFNHELGHALQTSFKGRNGKQDNRYNQLITNLITKYPDDFQLQATDETLTPMHEGMKAIRKNDRNQDARDFYAKNAYTTLLDEIFNEDESLKVTGVTQPQFSYDMGKGYSKNIFNYQSSNYKITSYGRMMKIVMGEDLTFKSMYEDSIVAYIFFDQFKDISDKVYQGKPPMFNILYSLNKIKSESSVNESQKLDLFLTACLQRKVAHDLKSPNITQDEITRIKSYINEFTMQMTRNPNVLSQQDQIIHSIRSFVVEKEKQISKVSQSGISDNQQDTLSQTHTKDYNYYFDEMKKAAQKYDPQGIFTEEQKKILIGEIFYNEGYLIDSLNNDEEISNIMNRAINELKGTEMQSRLKNIIISEMQEKHNQLHPKNDNSGLKHESRDNILSLASSEEKSLSGLTGRLRQELGEVEKSYCSMMADGYIDDEELATLIAMTNKVINDGYSLKEMASDPVDIKMINIMILDLEAQQKKMNAMHNGIEEIRKTMG